MDSELHVKAEFYETRAKECRQMALNTPEGARRVFYEVLADYHADLASDFRGVIAKRTSASFAAE